MFIWKIFLYLLDSIEIYMYILLGDFFSSAQTEVAEHIIIIISCEYGERKNGISNARLGLIHSVQVTRISEKMFDLTNV